MPLFKGHALKAQSDTLTQMRTGLVQSNTLAQLSAGLAQGDALLNGRPCSQ